MLIATVVVSLLTQSLPLALAVQDCCAPLFNPHNSRNQPDQDRPPGASEISDRKTARQKTYPASPASLSHAHGVHKGRPADVPEPAAPSQPETDNQDRPPGSENSAQSGPLNSSCGFVQCLSSQTVATLTYAAQEIQAAKPWFHKPPDSKLSPSPVNNGLYRPPRLS
ncbi:MAG: hypothetical protein LBP22_02080 [Deltaproteobacteria bacterium]|nr:hypothetical protein [Deltaproteobacteria bacterium]